MDYTTAHREVYDALAEEYERRVHDLTPVTEEAVSIFINYLQPGCDVLDIGCGVGLAIKLLNDRGIYTAGIEISPNMIKFAQKRNPSAEIIEGDFLKINFKKKYDGILAFAFIHLFSKNEAMRVLEKIHALLKPKGVLYIGTTESLESKEGWEIKDDYSTKKARFRKHWTEKELEAAIQKSGFKKLELHKTQDPFGKVWMDFIVQKD